MTLLCVHLVPRSGFPKGVLDTFLRSTVADVLSKGSGRVRTVLGEEPLTRVEYREGHQSKRTYMKQDTDINQASNEALDDIETAQGSYPYFGLQSVGFR